MITNKEFKNLKNEKQWRYIQYLQSRRTNSYLLIANIVVIAFSFLTLIFTAMQFLDVGTKILSKLFFDRAMFFVMATFLILSVIFAAKKYMSSLAIKKRLLGLTKHYFNEHGKIY